MKVAVKPGLRQFEEFVNLVHTQPIDDRLDHEFDVRRHVHVVYESVVVYAETGVSVER